MYKYINLVLSLCDAKQHVSETNILYFALGNLDESYALTWSAWHHRLVHACVQAVNVCLDSRLKELPSLFCKYSAGQKYIIIIIKHNLWVSCLFWYILWINIFPSCLLATSEQTTLDICAGRKQLQVFDNYYWQLLFIFCELFPCKIKLLRIILACRLVR